VREKAFVLRKELHAVVALAVLMVITAPLVLFIPMPLTGEVHYFNAYAFLADKAIERPADPERAAIGEMRRALHWDVLNHNYMAYLGAIYAQRGVRQGRLDDLDQAELWYTRALRLNPNDFWLHYRLATVRLERMRLRGDVDWDAALAGIGRAVEFFPTDPYMRVLYALHLDEAGRMDAAREQFALAEAYDEEAFTYTLRSAARRYNDPLELEQFKADLERLRATYGTRPAPEHDGAGPDGSPDNEHTGG
jgi:tetratricopeptide (TPR) repeat protein